MLHADFANWITSAFALTILLGRLAIARGPPHSNALSDAICLLSIFTIVARIPIIYFALGYGTVADVLDGRVVPASEAYQVKVGSVLSLIARFLSTTFYWAQTGLLLSFYTHMVQHIDWCKKAIKGIWIVLISTYLVNVVLIFLECKPFSHYWRMEPHPDGCSRAYVQIFVQGGLNIFLDILLLVISIPLWTSRNYTKSQLIRVIALMLLGTFCMIITGLKLAYVVGAHSNQATRSFWASIQILVSAFVANAPTIYGAVRLQIRRRREQQYSRRGSRPDSTTNLTMCRTRSNDELFTHMDREAPVIMEGPDIEETVAGPSTTLYRF